MEGRSYQPCRRRQAWLSAITRDDLTQDQLENCFESFFPAKLPNPGINLMLTGSRHYILDMQRNHGFMILTAARGKKIEKEILEKVKKLNEPEVTVESIFNEVAEHTSATQEAGKLQLKNGGAQELGM